jgi:hypothetical protein
MCSTIEETGMAKARLALLIAAVALAAVTLPAIVLPLAGPAKAARVIFFDAPDPSRLPEGVSIDRWRSHEAILSGVDARAARALYGLGAVVVYPIGSTGCLALSGK